MWYLRTRKRSASIFCSLVTSVDSALGVAGVSASDMDEFTFFGTKENCVKIRMRQDGCDGQFGNAGTLRRKKGQNQAVHLTTNKKKAAKAQPTVVCSFVTKDFAGETKIYVGQNLQVLNAVILNPCSKAETRTADPSWLDPVYRSCTRVLMCLGDNEIRKQQSWRTYYCWVVVKMRIPPVACVPTRFLSVLALSCPDRGENSRVARFIPDSSDSDPPIHSQFQFLSQKSHWQVWKQWDLIFWVSFNRNRTQPRAYPRRRGSLLPLKRFK